MFFWRWSIPWSAWKNTACLVTYLIATGHHLCVRFPLLVFRAQTRLISWFALIRGHISQHSRASYTACWEKWNAINQSGLLFNVLDRGNKLNADWLSDAEIKFVWWTENKLSKTSQSLQMCFCGMFWGFLKSGIVHCIKTSTVNYIFIHSS